MLVSAPGFGRAGDQAMRMLRDAGCTIAVHPAETTLAEDALIPMVAGADAIIAGMEPITARVIDAAPRLRIIARRGVGYDTVDVAAATSHGIPVAITVGALTDSVADHTMALLLAVARRIPELDRLVKSGTWDRTPAVDLWGKTLGIIGLGAIGREVARRGAGFRMRLLAFDTAPDPEAAALLGVTLCDLDTLLAESDFVTLHVPLNAATRGLINEHTLARMKPTAVLINTSRGPVIDEHALGRALRDGRLAGAGLDVFLHEPVWDLDLAGLPNVVATPHVASHTAETLARMERMCAEAVLTVLRGERWPHVANPEVYARTS